MNKEELSVQADKIYRALNTISVSGYGNIKTLGNCIDAMVELVKNINSYEKDVQDIITNEFEKLANKQMEETTNDGVTPVNPDKPRPKRNTKDGGKIGEN